MHGPSVSLTRFLGFYVEVGCKLTAHFTSLSSPLFSTSLFNLLIACYNTCPKETESLFGRAPAPAPPSARAGVLPNTLKMERLHSVACEKVEQQLCLREGGAGEATKISSTSSSSSSTFFERRWSPPKQAVGGLGNRESSGPEKVAGLLGPTVCSAIFVGRLLGPVWEGF